MALYGEGIFGSPIQASSLIGWWPLDDNSNDYSGNGQNGQYNNTVFQNIAEVDMAERAGNGSFISNVLIGAVISNVIAMPAHGASYGLTNSNGLLSDYFPITAALRM